jgi:hypothetical protein
MPPLMLLFTQQNVVWTGHFYRGKEWEGRKEQRKKNETRRKND